MWSLAVAHDPPRTTAIFIEVPFSSKCLSFDRHALILITTPDLHQNAFTSAPA
jgi:hypothetical protein